jgi:hypothetical protein
LFTKEKPNKEGGGIYFGKQYLSKRRAQSPSGEVASLLL